MRYLSGLVSLSLIEMLGWTLLHFVWQGALLAGALGAVLLLLRRSSANARYLAACLVLACMALCPVLTFLVLRNSANAGSAVSHQTGNGTSLAFEPAFPARSSFPASFRQVASARVHNSVRLREVASPPSLAPTPWERSGKLQRVLPWLVGGWTLGVLCCSLRLLGGWVQVMRLRWQGTHPVNEALKERVQTLARQMGISQSVELLESARLHVPAVLGCFRSVILLPASALCGLPQAQLEAILAHELAHIRRHDYLVNLAQSVLETLLFYHPGVWWVSHRLRIEREHCCDDLAVAVLGDRITYARALTALEELRSTPSYPLLAATGGDLLGRIRHILGRHSVQPVSWGGVLFVFVCAVSGLGAFCQSSHLRRKVATEPSGIPTGKTTLYTVHPIVPASAIRHASAPKRLSYRASSYPMSAPVLSDTREALAPSYQTPLALHLDQTAPEHREHALWVFLQNSRWASPTLLTLSSRQETPGGSIYLKSDPDAPDVDVPEPEVEDKVDRADTAEQDRKTKQEQEKVEQDRAKAEQYLQKAKRDLEKEEQNQSQEKSQRPDDASVGERIARTISPYVADRLRQAHVPAQISDTAKPWAIGYAANFAKNSNWKNVGFSVKVPVVTTKTTYQPIRYAAPEAPAPAAAPIPPTPAEHPAVFLEAAEMPEWLREGKHRANTSSPPPLWSQEDERRLHNEGVSSGMLRALASVGYTSLSVEDVLGLFHHRVTAKTIRRFQEVGYWHLLPRQLQMMQDHGVDPYALKVLQPAAWIDANRLSQLRDWGIPIRYVQQLKDLGYGSLTNGAIHELFNLGVTTDYIARLAQCGLHFAPKGLEDLKAHDVQTDFVKRIWEAGFRRLSVEDLLALRIHAVSADFMCGLRTLGYNHVSIQDVVNMSIHGVDLNYLQQLKEAGYRSLSIDEIVHSRITGFKPAPQS